MSAFALPTDHLPNDALVCLRAQQAWQNLCEACGRFAQQDAILGPLRSCDGRLDGAEIEMECAGVVRFGCVRRMEEALRLVVRLGESNVLVAAAGQAQVS